MVVLEKTLESPLDCKEIQPVHPKGDQPWVFFGRTDAKAETPILWPPHVKSWFIGEDWCWEGLGAGEGDDKEWDGWMASLTRWTWVWVNSGSWWWRATIHGVTKSWTWLRDWTELIPWYICATSSLSIYLLMDLGCFHVLAILSSAIVKIGEGNGTPLQYSCLENPMDRGAWWAAVHGVAKSWTWLTSLSLVGVHGFFNYCFVQIHSQESNCWIRWHFYG